MKLLVFDDEPAVLEMLESGLEALGHSVDATGEPDATLEQARMNRYDVIMLDVMVGGEPHGLTVARELRREGARTPILMLTASGGTEHVVEGLDAGADDYLTKPFHFLELDARLRALSRRDAELNAPQLRVASIELDPIERTVTRDGEPVSLTSTEFELLHTLMKSPARTFSRVELRRAVWGLDFDPGTRLVDVHVANLRRKLEAGGRPRVITSVRRVGFRLRTSETG